MPAHAQTWVKVNAQVDENLCEIVTILNSVRGLETLQSCQGEPGTENGYVYFAFGEWQSLCHFVFNSIAPRLNSHLGDSVSLEVIAAEQPYAKISFRAEAIPVVTSALKEVATA